MAAALVVLLVLLSEAAAGEVKDVVPVNPGDDVTLTCRAAGDIRAVKWTREDLKDKYVLLYRDGQTETDRQDPSFMDRVQLSDSELKDGDASLILKNVSINDDGTYECRVASDDSEDYDDEYINHVIRRLQLGFYGSDSSPPQMEMLEWAVLVLLFWSVQLLFWFLYKRQTVQGPVPPLPDEAAGDHLI